MKIKSVNQLNESSYHDFLTHYDEEIEKAINLLIKLENENYWEKCDPETLEKRLSVYDENVMSKIEDWIYDTPTKEEIAEFALKNQDRWGTEPQMVLFAIEDYANECGINHDDDDDDDDDGGFYEGSFQFDDENESVQIDDFTSRYYDNYDDDETQNKNNIELFEDFIDKITYEMSGSPKPYFKTKADFVAAMQEHGYYHTTLNKNTDMLVVAAEDLGTLKCQKAEKYGIPVYTYAHAKKEMKHLGDNVSKYNL